MRELQDALADKLPVFAAGVMLLLGLVAPLYLVWESDPGRSLWHASVPAAWAALVALYAVEGFVYWAWDAGTKRQEQKRRAELALREETAYRRGVRDTKEGAT